MNKNFLFLLICFSMFLAVTAAAAPIVTLSPASDGVYVLRGSDFSGISGVDMTIRYDATALSNPRVTQGSLAGGALIAANLATPGLARVALVRAVEINGSGPIATISFTRLKSTGADITALTASVLSGSGRATPVGTDIPNSQNTPESGSAADDQGTSGTATASTSSPSPGSSGADTNAPAAVPQSSREASTTTPGSTPGTSGILLIPVTPVADKSEARSPSASEPPATEIPQADVEKEGRQEPPQVALAERPAVKAPPAPEKKKVLLYQSVLEKFKEYKGEKTPKALVALFNTASGGKQEPPLVLSDGKSAVQMLLELDSQGENNNFLLEGVTLLSLKNKDKNRWIAELLPDSRAWQATITVPGDRQLSVMPLTVAPPMDVNIDRSSAKLTEADFKLFLKERGTAKAPRFDLNSDGKRDYIDEYIFTANYISQQHRKDPQKGMR